VYEYNIQNDGSTVAIILCRQQYLK